MSVKLVSEYKNQLESSFWLEVNSSHIYATAHIPIDSRLRGAVILCHAFAEEHKASYRTLVSLARELAKAGFVAIRFDNRGYGDSSGEFERFTVSQWIEDIEALAKLVRERLHGLPLIIGGLRLGATLAALSVDRLCADGFLLWQPVVSGRKFVQLNMTRMKLQRQLIAYESGKLEHEADVQTASHYVGMDSSEQIASDDIFTDFNGYIITKRLHEELCSIELTGIKLPSNVKGLLVQISGSTKLSSELAMLDKHLRSSVNQYSAVAIREQPIWSLLGLVEAEELINATVKWTSEAFPEKHPFDVPVHELFSDMPTSLGDESIVLIHTPKGWLKGILNAPGKHRDTCILFLHGWSGNRSGPHHMFSKLARRLARNGCASLRFDFRGRGESSGELYEGTLLTMIEDARCAIDWLSENLAIKWCVTIGICSGGEVAIGCAVHPRVRGCVLWSAPIFAGLKARSREARKRWSYFTEYLRKLFRPTTWRKLFSGQIQFGIIMRVLFGKVGDVPKSDKSSKGESEGKLPTAQAHPVKGDGFAPNEVLQREREQLEKLLREFEGQYSKPTLMVYGTGDPEAKPAIEWYGRIFDERKAPYNIHLVRGANHSFYSFVWEQEVLDVTEQWLSSLA
ncbi:MAG: alpha/beta fold hydrolase [Armatimonadota bacterium]|nr:alpha/beta hydrolase [Armatimonadota bacterium]MCX7777081.1 alpha/beta hydrolase [Armatimonadota bacterium]MDW8025128.1 alpha/beta fold hydrolase [Armatimonadota bacterium]